MNSLETILISILCHTLSESKNQLTGKFTVYLKTLRVNIVDNF